MQQTEPGHLFTSAFRRQLFPQMTPPAIAGQQWIATQHPEQREILDSTGPLIKKLVEENILSAEKAKERVLTYEEKANLHNTAILRALRQNQISLEEALKITPEQRKNFKIKHIDMLLEHRLMTPQGLLKLTEQERRNLSTKVPYLEQVKKKEDGDYNLAYYVAYGVCELHEVLSLTEEQRLNFASDEMHQLLAVYGILFDELKCW